MQKFRHSLDRANLHQMKIQPQFFLSRKISETLKHPFVKSQYCSRTPIETRGIKFKTNIGMNRTNQKRGKGSDVINAETPKPGTIHTEGKRNILCNYKKRGKEKCKNFLKLALAEKSNRHCCKTFCRRQTKRVQVQPTLQRRK